MLHVKILDSQEMCIKLDDASQISADFENITITSGQYPDYTGSYDITPEWRDQVLPTRLTAMRDDLTIREIYKSEVENEAGGLTLSI